MNSCYEADLLAKVMKDIMLLSSVETPIPDELSSDKRSVVNASYPILIYPCSLHYYLHSDNKGVIRDKLLLIAQEKYGFKIPQFNERKPILSDISKGVFYEKMGINIKNIVYSLGCILLCLTIITLFASLFIWVGFAVLYRPFAMSFEVNFPYAESYYISQCCFYGFVISTLITPIALLFLHKIFEELPWFRITKFRPYTNSEREELLQQKLQDYKVRLNQYKEQLQHDYSIIYNNLSNIYKDLWREKIEPMADYTYECNPKKGVFEEKLLRYFRIRYPSYIKGDTKIGPFFPDILLDIDGIAYIDIEIDEPYDLQTGDPIHQISGKDDLRNEFFRDCEIFVVRFAEFQICHYPNECISIVDAIVQFIKTGDPQCLSSIRDSVPPIKRWSNAQSRMMYMDSLRTTYDDCDWESYKNQYEEYFRPASLDVLYGEEPIEQIMLSAILKQIEITEITAYNDVNLMRITFVPDNGKMRYALCRQEQFYCDGAQRVPEIIDEHGLPITITFYRDSNDRPCILDITYRKMDTMPLSSEMKELLRTGAVQVKF